MSAFEDDLEEEDGECGAAPMLNGYIRRQDEIELVGKRKEVSGTAGCLVLSVMIKNEVLVSMSSLVDVETKSDGDRGVDYARCVKASEKGVQPVGKEQVVVAGDCSQQRGAARIFTRSLRYGARRR